MGATAEKQKNKIIRAVTLGINLTQDETLWGLFTDSPVGSNDTDEDKFYRLMIFEFALARTVSSDMKDFRYMREEPMKSAVYYATSDIDSDIGALITMLRNQCEVFRLNPGMITDAYKEVVNTFISRRFLLALSALHVIVKRLGVLFSTGKQISPEEISSYTQNYIMLLNEELEKDEIAWFSEMTGVKEERAREIIRDTREQIENS